MEIGDDSGPAPSEPWDRDYSVSVTGLVSRTFSLYVRRIVHYILIVGVVTAIMSVISFVVLFIAYGVAAGDLIDLVASDPLSLLFSIVSLSGIADAVLLVISFSLSILAMVVSAIVGGGAIKLALEDYGNPGAGDVNSALSYGASRAITLIIAQFIQALVIAIPLLPGLGIMVIGLATADPMDPNTFTTLLAAVPVILVGAIITLYLVVRLIPTIAVVVAEEDKSAIEALKRAYRITGGAFWHTFGGVLLLGIVLAIIGMVLSAILMPLTMASGVLGMVGAIIVALVLSPINFIFQAVLYRDLESRAKQTDADWW